MSLKTDQPCGTNHPNNQLQPVPPSFDKSVVYNSHVQLFLRMPGKLGKTGDPATEFWNEMIQRNQCSPKFAAKMLCVLHADKTRRLELLDWINANNCCWLDNNLSNCNKLVTVMNSNVQSFMFKLKEIDNQTFVQLNGSNVLAGRYLLSVSISLKNMVEKKLHDQWVQQLNQKYFLMVGSAMELDGSETINTYILWIPSITTFYLPFA